MGGGPASVGVTVGVTVGPGGVSVGVRVAVGVTPPATGKHGENSDVLLVGLVAVVKIIWPGATGNTIGPSVPLHVASVVTFVNPRNVWPSPFPEGSHAALENNSTRNVVLAVLSKVPEIVTVFEAIGAEVISG